MVQSIENTTNKLYKGQAGASFKHIHTYLKDVEPLAAAGIAIKLTFDKVFSSREDDDRKLVAVAGGIGRAIEDECQMQYYERTCPGLLKVIKDNYWHRAWVHIRNWLS